MLAMGYSCVPIEPGTKRPGPVAWQAEYDESMWLVRYAGYFIGVRTGYSNLVAVDLDALQQQLAQDLLATVVVGVFGPTPLMRIGRAPKCLLLYRTDGSITQKLTNKDTSESCSRSWRVVSSLWRSHDTLTPGSPTYGPISRRWKSG
jgi:hypothetical protein